MSLSTRTHKSSRSSTRSRQAVDNSPTSARKTPPQTKRPPARTSKPSFRKTKVFKSPYSPRETQKLIHNDEHRFRVIVAHRRFGKTTAALNELIKGAFKNPGRYWYIAPTYRQAKTIAWDLLLRFVPSEAIVEMNKQELTMKLISGSEIALKGVDNKDNLRGAGLKGVVLDECQEMDKEVWDAIISPMLLDTKGWAMFLGTPKGRNFLYDLFQKQQHKKQWKSFQFNAYDTGIYPKEEIDEFKESLPENTFREEYLAEFLEGEGTVFRNIKSVTKACHDCYEEPSPTKRYQIGVDLARLNDFTVITVVDQSLQVVAFERFQQRDWDIQKLKIAHTSSKFNNARVVIDATTYGDPIAQDLLLSGVNVFPFKFTNSSKKHLIENLQLRIEQSQIVIPDEPELLKELEAFTFEYTEANNLRYNAPKGFHDDAVISLALAVYDMIPSHFNNYQRYRETLFTPPIEDNWG